MDQLEELERMKSGVPAGAGTEPYLLWLKRRLTNNAELIRSKPFTCQENMLEIAEKLGLYNEHVIDILQKERDGAVNSYLDQRGLNQNLATQIMELRNLLRRASLLMQTSGGTAGRDENMIKLVEEIQKAVPPVTPT